MIIEGVTYHRFAVRFTLADGRRHQWVRWSPDYSLARLEAVRELIDRFGVKGIKPHSCTIKEMLK